MAGVGLEHVLLLAAVVELSLNRLAVQALRPVGGGAPPAWHTVLDGVGLFFQYFTSTLAVGAVGYMVWRHVRGPERPRPGWRAIPGYLVAAAGATTVVTAIANIALPPTELMSIVFDASFTLTLVFVAFDQLTARGDLGVKIGVVLMAVPLVIHFWPTFVVYVVGDHEALWGDLPIEFADYGKWAVVLAALASPYCFAPRPFLRSATRLAPVAVATFVGMVGAVILRKHYEVGMELAARGIGVDIGPGAPMHQIALFILALGAITWTLVSTISADSEARRRIGVGLGLVVVGGYSFAWPFQYLLGLAGIMTVSQAAGRVAMEEREGRRASRQGFRGPPIAAGVWQRYIAALMAGLRSADATCKPSTITIKGDEEVSSTHVVAFRRDVATRLRIDRVADSVLCIDITCGREPPSGRKPDLTLYARPDRLLGIRAHDEPPLCDGSSIKTGDAPFDSRFRLRDHGDHATALFDEGLRARATALLDGWVAFWAGRGLQYRVYPGRGAPLDHPIPITELAFRGESAAPAVDRLVSILELMVELAARAELTRARVGSTAEMAVQAMGLDGEPAAEDATRPITRRAEGESDSEGESE